MSIFLPEIIHDSSGSRSEIFAKIRSFIHSFSFPLLLLFLHGIVFTFSFPRLDLPIADDANYFGYAKLFARQGIALHADWTPILTYLGALFDKILPLGWYAQFALYSFFCRLTLLWGIYAFVLRFTSCRQWAFLSTVLSAICFCYWLQINGRAFCNGALLLTLAWIGPHRSLDLLSALALTAMSYLLRPEYVIICGGFCLYTLFLQYRQKSWKGLFLPSRITLLLLVFALALWLPIFWKGNIHTHRLNFAFSQFFERYATEEGLIEKSGFKWNTGWAEVQDFFFPPEKRNLNSPLSRIIPLYGMASANPPIFASFVWHNVRPFLTFEFELSQSPFLSKLLNYYIFALWIVFLVGFGKSTHRQSLYAYGLFSSIFLLSVLPCLIIRPFRDYVFSAVIWFFCVIPFTVIRNSRIRYWGMGVAILFSFFLQIPGWKDALSENSFMRNWKRAQFIDRVSQQISLKDAILAESYPVFCSAFHDEIQRSVHYELFWDNTGRLRSYGDKGPFVDYILLEASPPKHLLQKKKELIVWMQRWGEEVASESGFSLWKVHRRNDAPSQSVIVTDDSIQEEDLSGRIDEDLPEEKEIVIHWNFGEENFIDHHVYVSIDGTEYVYLGRSSSNEGRRLVWKRGNLLLESRFREGPEFGHSYQFQVYGIHPQESRHPRKILRSKAPFSYGRKAE